MMFRFDIGDIKDILNFYDPLILNNIFYINRSLFQLEKYDCLAITYHDSEKSRRIYFNTIIKLNIKKENKKYIVNISIITIDISGNIVNKNMFIKDIETIREYKKMYVKISEIMWNITTNKINKMIRTDSYYCDPELFYIYYMTVENYSHFSVQQNADYYQENWCFLQINSIVSEFIKKCEKNEKNEIGIKYLLFLTDIIDIMNFPKDLINITSDYIY